MLVDIHTLLAEHLTGITLAMARRDQLWRSWPHTFATSGRNLKSALFCPEHVQDHIIKLNGVNYADVHVGHTAEADKNQGNRAPRLAPGRPQGHCYETGIQAAQGRKKVGSRAGNSDTAREGTGSVGSQNADLHNLLARIQ